MVNSDPMINTTNNTTTVTPTASPSALPPEKPKEPSKFGQIMRGIAGGALNIVAPGVGSLVGGFMGGPNFGNMEQMLAQQQMFSMQMLSVQNRVQSQTQEFTTVSNLLKARHDGEMSAVNNFKS